MNIGTNIKKLRELKGFSRQHVADTIGVSLKTYGNIENELTSPDVKTLEGIAEAIEVSVYKLFNFDEKVILNNHGKHVENFGNSFNQYGMSEEQRVLFEKLIIEKDLRLKQYEEIILAKDELLKIYKSKKD